MSHSAICSRVIRWSSFRCTIIDASGRDIRLEVDGGIKVENVRRVADAGADTFVAGSAIFGQKDYRAVIAAMHAQLAEPSLAKAA